MFRNVDGDALPAVPLESVTLMLCDVLDKFMTGFASCVSLIMTRRHVMASNEDLDARLAVELLLVFLTKHGLEFCACLSQPRARDHEIDLIRSRVGDIVADVESTIRLFKNLTPYSQLSESAKFPVKEVQEKLAMIGTLEGLSLSDEVDVFFDFVQNMDSSLREIHSWVTEFLVSRQLMDMDGVVGPEFLQKVTIDLIWKHGLQILAIKAERENGEFDVLLHLVASITFDIESMYKQELESCA